MANPNLTLLAALRHVPPSSFGHHFLKKNADGVPRLVAALMELETALDIGGKLKGTVADLTALALIDGTDFEGGEQYNVADLGANPEGSTGQYNQRYVWQAADPSLSSPLAVAATGLGFFVLSPSTDAPILDTMATGTLLKGLSTTDLVGGEVVAVRAIDDGDGTDITLGYVYDIAFDASGFALQDSEEPLVIVPDDRFAIDSIGAWVNPAYYAEGGGDDLISGTFLAIIGGAGGSTNISAEAANSGFRLRLDNGLAGDISADFEVVDPSTPALNTAQLIADAFTALFVAEGGLFSTLVMSPKVPGTGYVIVDDGGPVATIEVDNANWAGGGDDLSALLEIAPGFSVTFDSIDNGTLQAFLYAQAMANQAGGGNGGVVGLATGPATADISGFIAAPPNNHGFEFEQDDGPKQILITDDERAECDEPAKTAKFMTMAFQRAGVSVELIHLGSTHFAIKTDSSTEFSLSAPAGGGDDLSSLLGFGTGNDDTEFIDGSHLRYLIEAIYAVSDGAANLGTFPGALLFLDTQPTATNTVVIGATTFTFVNGAPGGATDIQVDGGATVEDIIDDLVTAIGTQGIPGAARATKTPTNNGLILHVESEFNFDADAGPGDSVALSETLASGSSGWAILNMNESGLDTTVRTVFGTHTATTKTAALGIVPIILGKGGDDGLGTLAAGANARFLGLQVFDGGIDGPLKATTAQFDSFSVMSLNQTGAPVDVLVAWIDPGNIADTDVIRVTIGITGDAF